MNIKSNDRPTDVRGSNDRPARVRGSNDRPTRVLGISRHVNIFDETGRISAGRRSTSFQRISPDLINGSIDITFCLISRSRVTCAVVTCVLVTCVLVAEHIQAGDRARKELQGGGQRPRAERRRTIIAAHVRHGMTP